MTITTSVVYNVVHITVRGVCVVWTVPSSLRSSVEHKLVLKKQSGKEKVECHSLCVDKSLLQNMSCCQHIYRQAEIVAPRGLKCYL